MANVHGTHSSSPLLASSSSSSSSLKINGGDLSEDERVMSDIHLGCPPALSGPHSSLFTFSVPSQVEAASKNDSVQLDEDGDLVLTRRNNFSIICCQEEHFREHNVTSSIPNVGLQVWRAELLLSDFLLHKMSASSELDGIVSLELGAGTGLAGMLLARVAKTVFLTDRGDEILNNCSKNIEMNRDLFNTKANVLVRELDWMNSWPPTTCLEELPTCSRHSWTSLEVEEAQEASLLLAADVVYSDDLTDAFFQTVEKLMCLGSEKVLYLTLEKRYNFSLDDLDVVANGYLRFRSYLRDEKDSDCSVLCSTSYFVGKCIDIAQIPQYVREYERGNDVELWKITYIRRS